MLALLGKLFNVAVGWALPGLSASALYIVAGLLAIGVPAGWAYHKGVTGCAASLATEKAACAVRIANMQTAAERTISDILSSVDPAEHDGKTAAELCKGDPLCVEGGK